MRKFTFLMLILISCSCSSKPSIPIAESVDLERFMGKWYVIASIPTFIEKDAYNATEYYQQEEGNKIKTAFSFNQGSPSGIRKIHNPIGFVTKHPSNAIWKMQFLWPFKMDYRIVHLDSEYQHTIVGREKRDFVWIMSRSSKIDSKEYQNLVQIVKDAGYKTDKLKLVPQSERTTKLP